MKVILSGSGVGDPDNSPCVMVSDDNEAVPLHDLQLDIEEADIRLIPHALHAEQYVIKYVVILSNNTDVVVLEIHYVCFSMFHCCVLIELWLRVGVGDTARYISLHTLTRKLCVSEYVQHFSCSSRINWY